MRRECGCELNDYEWVLCREHDSPSVLYLLNSYQARVKELEGQLCDAIDEINACADLIDPRKAKEIVRLRKVVDAAREVEKQYDDPQFALEDLFKALRELDGEKQ